MKKLALALLVTGSLVAATPAVASAKYYATESAAESHLWDIGDIYLDEGYSLDYVTCEGYGRTWRGMYNVFECESDYSDAFGEDPFTDVDRLKTRKHDFSVRTIRSY